MAVRIRLQRHGRKKRPFYRIVAADARAQRDGVFLERLGHYNPLTDPADVLIDEEKALKWLRRGAQPTDTAKRLLSQSGIWKKFTYEKLGKPLPEDEVADASDTPEDGEAASVEQEQAALLTETASEETDAPEAETAPEEADAQAAEAEAPAVETEAPAVETEAPAVETEAPAADTAPEEADAPAAETASETSEEE